MSSYTPKRNIFTTMLLIFAVFFMTALMLSGCVSDTEPQYKAAIDSMSVGEQLDVYNIEQQSRADAKEAYIKDVKDYVNMEVTDPEPPKTKKGYKQYINSLHGFEFYYPEVWTLEVPSGSEIVFTGKKVIDLKAAKTPDRFTITITWLKSPGEDDEYEEWFSKFPKGSEKVKYNDEIFEFSALDTEGPFYREHYRRLNEYSALKFELNFLPATVETYGELTNYTTISHQYGKEVYQEFVKMIGSTLATML